VTISVQVFIVASVWVVIRPSSRAGTIISVWVLIIVRSSIHPKTVKYTTFLNNK
jgi:hypothetical protein